MSSAPAKTSEKRCPQCSHLTTVTDVDGAWVFNSHGPIPGTCCGGTNRIWEDPDQKERERQERYERIKAERQKGAPEEIPKLRAIRGGQIATYPVTKRDPILMRGETVMLKAKQLWQVVAYRGVGKSWFLMTLALIVSTGKEALGFRALKARPVLYIDGEMALEDVLERFQLLSSALDMPMTDNLVIVSADDQETFLPKLDSPAGQAAMAEHVEAAEVIFIDNRSCLFDSEGEKDPTAWSKAQDWLLSLRFKGKTPIWAHHANRLGGTRGISKPEDVIDLELKLSWQEGYRREDGCRFIAEWGKTRGVHGPELAPFVAQLKDGRWEAESESQAAENETQKKILAHVRMMADISEPVKSANQVVKDLGGKRIDVLSAWRDLRGRNLIIEKDGAFLVTENAS